jgi:flavodoxin
MKALIVYDSLYGNTEQIAKAIGGGMGGEVKVVRVGEANPAELGSYDLLIVGSATQVGRLINACHGIMISEIILGHDKTGSLV